MAVALNPKKFQTYVLLADRKLPKEQQTRFTHTCLTKNEEIEFTAATAEEAKPGENVRRLIAIVRRGLKGWENFNDASGGAVPFDLDPSGEPNTETLDQIRTMDLIELARAIMGNPTTEEVGKL